jgi:hypothetical protein
VSSCKVTFGHVVSPTTVPAASCELLTSLRASKTFGACAMMGGFGWCIMLLLIECGNFQVIVHERLQPCVAAS